MTHSRIQVRNCLLGQTQSQSEQVPIYQIVRNLTAAETMENLSCFLWGSSCSWNEPELVVSHPYCQLSELREGALKDVDYATKNSSIN